MEKIAQDPFRKNQKLGVSAKIESILKLRCRPLAFTSNKTFLKNKEV